MSETDSPVYPETTAQSRRSVAVGLRGLARSASGSFALNVINTAATVLTTIVLARVLDLTAFGIYAWVVATVYLLSVPALLGADRLLIRDVAVYIGQGAHGHVRGLVRRSIQLVLATCAAIGLLAALIILASNTADPTTVAAISIGLLALPALALAWVAQSVMIGLHHVVVGQLPELLVRPLLILGGISGALLIGVRIDAPLAAVLFVVSAAASALLAFLLLRRKMNSIVRREARAYDSRRWLIGASGLVLLSGAVFANSQIGVVMLGLLDEADSAGLYAVAQRGALLVAFPLLALNAAIAPTAARLWARGDRRELQRLVTVGARVVLAVSVPIALVFILAGNGLVDLVFGAAFLAAAGPLAILSLGQIANVATGPVATLLMMTGQHGRAAAGIALGLVLNVGLCLVLIPIHGATGAAVAAATALVVANIIHVAMARRALGLDATALGLAPGRSS